MDLSIIVPAFDEVERIAPTLRAFDAHLEGGPRSFEILVVDDGSTDGTADLVESLAARHPSLRCQRSPRNRGKGHALRLGMLAARGTVRVMADADGSTPVSYLPALLEPILAGRADLALGSRYLDGARIERLQPLHRRLFSRVANRLVQALLLPGIVDAHCGFKAFEACAAEALFSASTIDGWSFDLEILALARRQGFRIAEVPVAWADDPRSRVSPLPDLWRSTRELLLLRSRFGRTADVGP